MAFMDTIPALLKSKLQIKIISRIIYEKSIYEVELSTFAILIPLCSQKKILSSTNFATFLSSFVT